MFLYLGDYHGLPWINLGDYNKSSIFESHANEVRGYPCPPRQAAIREQREVLRGVQQRRMPQGHSGPIRGPFGAWLNSKELNHDGY